MNVKTIYEKKFPPTDIEKIEQDISEMKDTLKNDRLSFDEIMNKLFKDITFVPLPDRIKNSEKFIEMAIELSEHYEIDIVIKRYHDSINVNYYFDGGSIRNINNLFGMADEFSFGKDVLGYDIEVSLTYYTHAKTRQGRTITP